MCSFSLLAILVVALIYFNNVSQVLCQFKMTITYGEPESFTGSGTYSLSWDVCVSKCLETSSCVVVYELSDASCQEFLIGQISSVKHLESGNRIAIKSQTNSTTCPLELTAYEETGYGMDETTYRSYTVSYTEPLWTISINETYTCPKNFKIFRRPLGLWCLQVDPGSCYSFTVSSGKCTALGAQMSGPENSVEYNYIAAQSLVIWKKLSGYSILAVWVDGSRRSECAVLSEKFPACNGTNEFSFSDPTLPAVPPGYTWDYGQPDGMNSTVTAACIVVRVTSAAYNGMDDCACGVSKSATQCFRGYVCGVEPTSS